MIITNNRVRGIGKTFLIVIIAFSIIISSFSFVNAGLGLSDSSKPKLAIPVTTSSGSVVNNYYTNGSELNSTYCYADGTNISGVDCLNHIISGNYKLNSSGFLYDNNNLLKYSPISGELTYGFDGIINYLKGNLHYIGSYFIIDDASEYFGTPDLDLYARNVYGDGYGLSNVCKSDGTGCLVSSTMNYTNIAMKNASNSFSAINTFNNNTILNNTNFTGFISVGTPIAGLYPNYRTLGGSVRVINTTNATDQNYGAIKLNAYTSDIGTSSTYRTLHFETTGLGNSSGSTWNNFDSPMFTTTPSAGSTWGTWTGYSTDATMAGGGVITTVNGLTTICRTAGTGNITTCRGLYTRDAGKTSTGVVNNLYGLYVQQMDRGTRRNVNLLLGDTEPAADTNWSIYSSSTHNSYLAGTLNINNIFSVGNLTGNVTIDNVNALTLYGNSTVWDDLSFPVANTIINPSTSKPDADVDNVYYLFDDASIETIRGSGQSSHSQKNNTGLYCHVHWVQSATGTVIWNLNYTIGNLRSTTQTWYNMNTTGNISSYSTGDLQQLSYFPITATNITDVSAIFRFKLSRLGSATTDTMVGDAKFESFDCHYEKDSLGSSSEYRK